MGFWVQSEGKESWSGDSLVEGREATWEKKARELGGVFSLNQKRKGEPENKRKGRKAACVSEKEQRDFARVGGIKKLIFDFNIKLAVVDDGSL